MIAIDPKHEIEIVLSSDEGRPADERPTFIGHYLTCREHLQFERELAAAIEVGEKGDTEALLTGLAHALRLVLCGWRNVRDRSGAPVAYDPERLLDILTIGELYELMRAVRAAVQLSEADRKNCDSP